MDTGAKIARHGTVNLSKFLKKMTLRGNFLGYIFKNVLCLQIKDIYKTSIEIAIVLDAQN